MGPAALLFRCPADLQVLEFCDLDDLSSALMSDSFLRRADTSVPVTAESFRSCCDAPLSECNVLDELALGLCAIDGRGLLLSLVEVASALSYLHRMGIVHCDVKVRGTCDIRCELPSDLFELELCCCLRLPLLLCIFFCTCTAWAS